MMTAGPGARRTLTRSFTWVLLRCHFSLGCEGVNTDTSLPSSSRMLELSCRMTWGTEAGHRAGSSLGGCYGKGPAVPGAGNGPLAGSAVPSNPLILPTPHSPTKFPSLLGICTLLHSNTR